jgi:hypothetical protein
MSVTLLGIDPGPERSAYAILDDGVPGAHAWLANDHLLCMLAHGFHQGRKLCIETLHTRGEPVSQQAMNAQLWAGRFIQAACGPFECVDERDGRFAASGNQCAKEKHVRIGLENQFGEDRQVECLNCINGRVSGAKAGRTKQCPKCKGTRVVRLAGPLSGFNEHERSALAAALYVYQKSHSRKETA